MRNRLADLRELNAEVWAVDPHETWAAKFMMKDSGTEEDDLRFPLLMDPTFTVSATYGVAFQMRVHTEWSNRPATFVIDREGVTRFIHRGTRFNDRPKVNDLIELLNSLTEGSTSQ